MKNAALVLFALLGLACAHGDANPKPLGAPVPHDVRGSAAGSDDSYSFRRLARGDKNTDSMFVVLTLSGGGTRAAALAYGVIRELQSTEVVWEGQKKTLLDEVDVISSVSGGSFAAAFYAANKASFVATFPKAFLTWNLQGELIDTLHKPSVWSKYHHIGYSRIDYAADLYRERLFKTSTGAALTFGDLTARPLLLINATDMTQGSQFTFCERQFQSMCRRLDSYPIARAVAASSAFPVLLAPLAVENYAGYCTVDHPAELDDDWHDCLSANPMTVKYDNWCDEVRKLAAYQNSATRPFVHLLDGGIADNVGVLPVIAMFSDHRTDPNVLGTLQAQAKAGKRPIGIVIVVNAKTGGRTRLDQSAATPDVRSVLSVATGTPMANFTDESLRRLHNTIGQPTFEGDVCLDKVVEPGLDTDPIDRRVTIPGASCKYPLRLVEVSFSAIPDPGEREFFLNIPTAFTLPPRDVEVIGNVGGKLLREDRRFHRLLELIKERDAQAATPAP